MFEQVQSSRAVLLGAVAIFSMGLTTSGMSLATVFAGKMAERTVTFAALPSAM